MSEPVTDSNLVLRAGRGDSIAFSELVSRHYRRALRVAFGLLRDVPSAEDVVQESFARVHRRLRSFPGASAFYIWLYRIIVTLCLARPAREAAAGEAVDLAPEAETGWPRAHADVPLQTALAALPRLSQAILLLRELEGFSYDEVAVTLQVNKSLVVRRLYEARKALQPRLVAAPDGKKAFPKGAP